MSRLLFEPGSLTVQTAREMIARHIGLSGAPCTCCGASWPCPPLLRAVAVCQGAGLHAPNPLPAKETPLPPASMPQHMPGHSLDPVTRSLS